MWKMRHFLRDGHVEINENCPQYLLQYQNSEWYQNLQQSQNSKWSQNPEQLWNDVGYQGKNRHQEKKRHQNRWWRWNKRRRFSEEQHDAGQSPIKELQKQFSRLRYDNLEQVIYEVLTSYLELTDEKDIFCVAMHGQHVRLLKDALRDKKLILSFFEERYSVATHPEGVEIIEAADYLVVDSQKNMIRKH